MRNALTIAALWFLCLLLNAESGLSSKFVLVQGGFFAMGVDLYRVDDFFIDRFEVTQASYAKIMGRLPATHNGFGPLFPVYGVTWYNAVEYCNRRSIAENLDPCYSIGGYGSDPEAWPSGWDYYDNQTRITCDWSADGYRLPTEAEWSFAAKGGNKSHDYLYSGSNRLDSVAWYAKNSDAQAQQVGLKQANELGLYDMSGNVWEWCWDYFSDLPAMPQADPHGPESGSCRVTKGGGFNTQMIYCPVDFHNNGGHADLLRYNVGFRLARSAW